MSSRHTQQKITDFLLFSKREKSKITHYFPNLPGVKKYKSNKHYMFARSFSRKFLNEHYANYKPDAYRSRKGYFFVAENDFQEYSVYLAIDKIIMVKGAYVTQKAGEKVGEATIDSNSALSSIEIYQEHQRNGIGTELIRFIKHCDKQFHVHCGVENNSRYRLSEEGSALVRACVNKKILTENDLLAGVPMSPKHSCFF